MLRNFLTLIGVYKLYEKWLKYQLKDKRNIEHIAMVVDEDFYFKNTKEKVLSLSEKIIDLLEWCVELQVKTITVYILSMDLLQTSPGWIGDALELLEKGLNDLCSNDILHKYKIRAKVIGRTNLLPERLRSLIRALEESTRGYDEHYLNLAIAYRGKTEIVDAARKMAEDVKADRLEPHEVDEAVLERYLYTAHTPKQDPDLIIRTSGDERLSGFLLWQSAYSELCFLDVNWPDIRKIDILRAMRIFQKRKRRFGL